MFSLMSPDFGEVTDPLLNVYFLCGCITVAAYCVPLRPVANLGAPFMSQNILVFDLMCRFNPPQV